MQMNKQKYLPLFLFALLVTALLPPLLVVAQDEPPAEPKPAPATEQPRQTLPAAEIDRSDTRQNGQQVTEPTDPATGKAARPLKDFKPTEKIAADSAVSFPVDI